MVKLARQHRKDSIMRSHHNLCAHGYLLISDNVQSFAHHGTPMRQCGEVATVTHFPPSSLGRQARIVGDTVTGSEHQQYMLRMHGNGSPTAAVAVARRY
jgi:hypothetical protein